MKPSEKDLLVTKYISVWGWFILAIMFLCTTIIVVAMSNAKANLVIFFAASIISIMLLFKAFRYRYEVIYG